MSLHRLHRAAAVAATLPPTFTLTLAELCHLRLHVACVVFRLTFTTSPTHLLPTSYPPPTHLLPTSYPPPIHLLTITHPSTITPSRTYGALDPVQVATMAPHLSTIYVSGWQCSSTASSSGEPGPDFADYPMDTGKGWRSGSRSASGPDYVPGLGSQCDPTRPDNSHPTYLLLRPALFHFFHASPLPLPTTRPPPPSAHTVPKKVDQLTRAMMHHNRRQRQALSHLSSAERENHPVSSTNPHH